MGRGGKVFTLGVRAGQRQLTRKSLWLGRTRRADWFTSATAAVIHGVFVCSLSVAVFAHLEVRCC